MKRRSSRGAWALACAGALFCGAALAELPDLRRGQKALEEGDFAAAEADLLPLAEAGYQQAQEQLARLYTEIGTPEAIQDAIYWYRAVLAKDQSVAVPLAHALLRSGDPAVLAEAEQSLRRADKNGDPRALAALIDFFTDYPQFDREGDAESMVKRAEKRDRPETEGVVIRWYRKSADPRHHEQLVKRCIPARERQPECYVDLARHYRATSAGKPLVALGAAALKHSEKNTMPARILERFAWALISDEVGGLAQPELAYRIMKRAGAGNPQSQVRLARLLVEHPQIDPAGNPEALLRSAFEQGSPEAALALGRLYMTGTRVSGDWALAEKYLQQAAPSQPAAHYFLGRIYKRGALGRDDPVLAARHYLTSARAGYVNADMALAQLFSDARGARVNRVNAWVFARIAADNSVPRSAELLAQIKAAMPAAELKRAEQLWRQEVAARQAPNPGLTAEAQLQPQTENTP
jgi:alginate biosynthesis protein AlgK